MKVLVLGASGFIGKKVASVLSSEYDIYRASREPSGESKELELDLLDKEDIKRVLSQIKPEAIINCAGIVENSEKASLNVKFTRNLLEAIVETKIPVKSIIICGSAAEYGKVEAKNLPVKETTPLRAESPYALGKKEETEQALSFKKQYRLPITVVRIFNPVGRGMNPRLLIPSIARQIKEIEAGRRDSIEVTRLDSKRDYIAVDDVALAIKTLVEGQPKQDVYNVGSGTSISNEQLVDTALKYSNLNTKPKISQTQSEPESIYAIQADISRIKDEFGWQPRSTIEDTIKEIFDASR